MAKRNDVFTILVICRANVARSYMAEEFLKHGLQEKAVSAEFRVLSRGTQVSGEQRVPEEVVEIVAHLDGRGRKHVPTQVRAIDLTDSDLILVAEKGMEEVLLDLNPASAKRTFSLIEFGRLVSDPLVDRVLPANSPAESAQRSLRLSQQIATLSNYRGYLTVSDEPEDIEDPAGKKVEALHATAKIVEKWSGVVADWCART